MGPPLEGIKVLDLASMWAVAGGARTRGYDLLVQAAAGILGRRSMPDGTPRTTGIWAVDMATSPLLAYAVTLALIERGRTGRGQCIDGSLLASAIAPQMGELIRG